MLQKITRLKSKIRTANVVVLLCQFPQPLQKCVYNIILSLSACTSCTPPFQSSSIIFFFLFKHCSFLLIFFLFLTLFARARTFISFSLCYDLQTDIYIYMCWCLLSCLISLCSLCANKIYLSKNKMLLNMQNGHRNNQQS